MNIRNRLLCLLLPPLIAFVALSSGFFYYQWRKEILATFKARLEAVVVTTAKGIQSRDILWLYSHRHDVELAKEPLFMQIDHQLHSIAHADNVESLSIIAIEPVARGEAILPDRPVGPDNPLYQGDDPLLAYRQLYLLDITSTPHTERAPGSYDFSETGEHHIYDTHQPLVTPIYTARYGQEQLISAYAPIVDAEGNVLALVGADVSMAQVDQKLRRALLSLVGSALATVILVSLSVLVATHKISRPVQQLKDAALNIAAGDYDTTITVTEPLEIAELANTFNTMSACLKEHLARLQQNATARERLLGEYECALLLQKRMFQHSLEQFAHPHLQLSGLQSQVASQPHGIYLRLAQDMATRDVTLTFDENTHFGFDSLYQLISDPTTATMTATLHFRMKPQLLSYRCHHLPPPLLWSGGQPLFLEGSQGECPWLSGDLLLIASSSLRELFPNENDLKKWLVRFPTHFSGGDFALFTSMVDREIEFLCSRCHLERDLFVVCAQLT